MTKKVFTLTRPGGFVSIVHPSSYTMLWMGCGGYWPGATRGWLEEQIDRQIKAGHVADAAVRWVKALMFGGLVTHEALTLMRDRNCAHRGTGIELWNWDDVPTDRWFRDAWRRSANGGPIWVDLDAARFVQMDKCVAAVNRHNKEQESSSRRWGHNGPQIIGVDYDWIKRNCEAAGSTRQLKAVWPRELLAYA